MVKTKFIYTIGSIIIGCITIIGVIFGLIAGGVISTQQSKIVIVSASAEKVYDGTDFVCNEWTIESGELKDGHVATVTFTSKLKNVGTSENFFTVTINDHVGADVTNDYVIDKQFGTLEVQPRPITILTKNAEKVYDGEPISNKEWEISQDSLVASGENLHVEVTGSLTNVGLVTNEADVHVYSKDGKDVSQNYVINRAFGTLEVKPIDIVVYTSSANKIYDGEELAETGWKVSEDTPIMDGHHIEVTTFGRITEVGETENDATAKIMLGDDDVTNNYNIDWEFGTLTVKPCPITLFTETARKTYDGQPLTCEEWWYEGDLVGEHEIKVSFNATITDAGTKENYATVSVFDGDNNVSYNYDVEKVLGSLIVDKREIAVRSGSSEKEYDGVALKCNEYEVVSHLDVLPEHTLYVTISGEQLQVGDSDNTFGQIYIEAVDENGQTTDVTRNYSIEKQPGILTVTGIPVQSPTEDNPDTDLGGGDTNDDTVFAKVKSSRQSKVYLRMYSHGDYTGKGWTSGETYSEKIDNKYSYNYLFSIMLYNAKFTSYPIEIESYYNYMLPYYMEKSVAGYTVQSNDVYYTGDYSDSYSLYYYDYDFIKDGTSAFTGVNLGGYTDGASLYEVFVKSKYLSVPTSTLSYLNTLIADNSFKASDPDIIKKVAQFIQNSAKYDLKYDKTLDAQSDIVVSFLRDYKTGICQHYASAATLLYRALGFPARYTVGFVTDTEANEWVEVKGSQAHAWVEIYLSGRGWVQIEVTGGSGGSGGTGGSGGSDGETGDGSSGETGDSGGSSNNPNAYTVTPVNVSAQYNGTNSVVATNKVRINKALPEGYTTEVQVSGERSEPGKGTSEVSEFKIYNASSELVYHYKEGEVLVNTEELTIKFKTGTLHLYIHKLKFTSSSYSKVYDGTILVSGGEYQWSGTLEPGHKLGEVKLSNKIINVGSVSNGFSVKIVDESGKDVTDMYYIEKNTGKLTVTHREITITAGSKTVTYVEGMSDVTCDTYTVTSTQYPDLPIATNQSLDLCMTEESRLSEQGFAVNEIDVSSIVITDLAGEDVTGNYIIKTKSGVIVVR